jgi:hypothetical protein
MECPGRGNKGWSFEKFHRETDVNFTEEDVHEVAAHLLCNLGDQMALLTNQYSLRVGERERHSPTLRAPRLGERTLA